MHRLPYVGGEGNHDARQVEAISDYKARGLSVKNNWNK